METFVRLTSHMVPLPGSNIDTDQIIPASFLKVTSREGMQKGLFANWRYDDAGRPKPDFVLNQPLYREAQILLAGDNFGSGSSREHAAWALLDFGFRAVVSTRFADIFQANAAKNGLLTATVSPEDHAALLRLTEKAPQARISVDLEESFIESPELGQIAFDVDPFARHCLLNGVDQLGFLLERLGAVAAYEAGHPQIVETTQHAAREDE